MIRRIVLRGWYSFMENTFFVSKKTLYAIYTMISLENLAVLKMSGYVWQIIVMVGIFSIFPIFLLLFKIFRKKLNAAKCCQYVGLLSTYSAFISAVYLSYYLGTTLKKFIAVFLICCMVIVLIIVCLELYCRNRSYAYDGKKKASPLLIGMAAIGGTIGVLSSRFFDDNTEFKIILGVMMIIYAIFYNAIIKYRHLKRDSNKNDYIFEP